VTTTHRVISGELGAEAIEALLHAQLVARLAYVDRRGKPNIVPIAYAYDGRAFFGYSRLGSKLEGMGAHPEVCLEVDRIHDAANWSSVVVHGRFEQLHGEAAREAAERIAERMRTVALAENAPAPAALTHVERAGGPGIAYRIVAWRKHGRYSASE
jgi:uncharacterized protein